MSASPEPVTAAVDPGLVAYCGLYCAACRSYRKGRCPGCRENVKATWCAVRTCCMDHGYANCAACDNVDDFRACKKLNNFISKIFGFVFRSDRPASIERIREIGADGFAREMAERGEMSVKRR